MHATLQSDTQNPISCHPIRFSSFPAHALHGSEKLCFHDKHAFHQCVRLHEDGWIRGPNGQLLLWVPAGNRDPFYSPFTRLVMPRGGVELDLSKMAYGSKWQECFEPWQHYYSIVASEVDSQWSCVCSLYFVFVLILVIFLQHWHVLLVISFFLVYACGVSSWQSVMLHENGVGHE